MKLLKNILLKRLSLAIGIILSLSVTAAAQHPKNTAYVEKYNCMAVALMHEYQIPASVILGVAMVESGSGTSLLSRKFHNHFGVMGKNTHAIKKLGKHSRYREFESDTASFRYFCELMSRKQFYRELVKTYDHRQWVKAIRKSGYASAASHWQDHVLNAIEKNNLTCYDTPEPDPLNYLPREINGVKTNGMLVNSCFIPVKKTVSPIPASSSNLKASK